MNMAENRKHAAIMFTDIVGYTALMGSDEDRAFDVLNHNRKIHSKLIVQFNGTLIKEMGDGMLISFGLASDAVRCAIEIQKACKAQEIPLKIGIHEGEMVFEGADVLGDAVNVASRLESDTKEGCIYISGSVYRDIKNRSYIRTKYIKEKTFKNVDEPIKVYQVLCENEPNQQPTNNYTAKRSGMKPYYLLAGLVVVALSILIVWKVIPSKPAVELEKSIAVLPFKYLSQDQSRLYMCDGVMDVITSHLAKISSLQVKARTSVEKYRDNLKDAVEIGQELKVNYIVEGSFQLQESTVRLTIQLINAKNGNHIFTNEYDREWSDIFKVQSEVAQTIAREIEAVINPNEKKFIESIPTKNLTAYDFYMQAEEELKTFERQQVKDSTLLDKALNHYRMALENDSTLAEAYLGLANIYMKNLHIVDIYFKNAGVDSVLSLIDISLSYNDQLEKAYYFLGIVNAYYLGDIHKGLFYLEKTLTINPNYAQGYGVIADIYMGSDDLVNAIPNYYKSIELDETYWKPWNLNKIMWCFFASGFNDQANFFALEKLKLDADSIDYLISLSGIEFVRGNLAKSLELLKKVYSMDSTIGDVLNMIIQISSINGNNSEALHYAILLDSLIVKQNLIALIYSHRVGYAYWINGFKERAKYYFDKQLNNCLESIKMKRPYGLYKTAYYDLAALYAFYGDKEKALKCLEEYNTKKYQRSILIQWLEKDPLFDSIRDDERFNKIQNDMKINYQSQHDKLEVWLKEKGYL